MRIGVICNSFMRSGGMESYALGIVDALIKLGHKPVIFCKKADSSLPFYKACEVYVCPHSWLPSKVRTVYFNYWLRKIRSCVFIDFAIGCCLNSVSEVVACGGTHLGFLSAMKKWRKISDSWVLKIERASYLNAKAVIAHSEMMKRELIDYYGVEPEKIHLIYPPHDIKVNNFEMDKEALRRKFNLPLDKKLFLFPSSSHKRKGFDLLKEYFEKCDSNYELIVAGRPIGGQFRNIRYVGFCKEMSALYQACDYSILASLYEPLGLVGIESVLNGTPCIMKDNIGCREVISPKAISVFSNIEELSKVTKKQIELKKPYSQYIKPEVLGTYVDHVRQLCELNGYK